MTNKAIVDVNLLPRESRPIEASPASIAFAAVVLTAVLALVPFGIMTNSARSGAVAAEERAQGAQDQLAPLQLDLTTHRGLRAALAAARKEEAALTERRRAFQGGSFPLAHDVAVALEPRTAPAGVTITSVSSEATVLRIVGLAPGPLVALDFADALAAAGPYDSVQLRAYAPARESGGEFTLDVTR